MKLLSRSFTLLYLIFMSLNLIFFVLMYYFSVIPMITTHDVLVTYCGYSFSVLVVFVVVHIFIPKNVDLTKRGLIILAVFIVCLLSGELYYKTNSDGHNEEIIKKLRKSQKSFFTNGRSLVEDSGNRLLIKKICQIKNSKSQFFIDYYKVDCEMFKSK